MDEIIIEFPPEQEGITWNKRIIIQKPINKVVNQTNAINYEELYNIKIQTPKMNDDFRKYIFGINSRIDEYYAKKTPVLLKQLKDDYTILCVNYDNFGKPQEMTNCISRLNSLLGYKSLKNKKLNKDKLRIQGLSDLDSQTTKHVNNTFSSKGLLIVKQLSEIKVSIKKVNNKKEDIDYLLKKLQEIKDDIENNLSVFTNVDNIQVRLQQIEQYKIKLRESFNSLTLLNTNVETTQDTNGKKTGTKRGLEIQEELANLRDEAKRKDLNPIEKENLINSLLKLQKEIISNGDKFSKYDSIPVRLDQIENYLEKLKEKPIKKDSVPLSKPKDEQKEEDKSKKKVIWKFGL